jgi:hypothetical protein
MSLAAAQERYDNQLPEEMPEGHNYTGDVVLDDENGEPTMFSFYFGKIVAVSIDENGTTVPYAQWNGSDNLAEKADAEAAEMWEAQIKEMQNDY